MVKEGDFMVSTRNGTDRAWVRRGFAFTSAASFIKLQAVKRLLWLGWAVLVAAVLVVAFGRARLRREHSQDVHILAAARRYGLEAALIKAIVWRESYFDARVRGRAGEVGLMQITELAAEEWAEAERLPNFQHFQLFDPSQNVRAGSWYFRKLLGRYLRTDNPFAYALADYNAGRTHVLRWSKGAAATNSALFLAQIDFPGTKRYVESVLQRYNHYRPSFQAAPE